MIHTTLKVPAAGKKLMLSMTKHKIVEPLVMLVMKMNLNCDEWKNNDTLHITNEPFLSDILRQLFSISILYKHDKCYK